MNPEETTTAQKSAEDKARDLLQEIGVNEADKFTAGDLVSLANIINELEGYKKAAENTGSEKTPLSATDAVAEIMSYSHPLYEAFDDAVKQATKGKGTRHGGEATPFLAQPIFQISKHTGVGGLIFQMVKKAQEACGKDDQEAFERELLGALVYGGAAYLYVKQHGFKKVEK